jgi:hypothetical protein
MQHIFENSPKLGSLIAGETPGSLEAWKEAINEAGDLEALFFIRQKLAAPCVCQERRNHFWLDALASGRIDELRQRPISDGCTIGQAQEHIRHLFNQ